MFFQLQYIYILFVNKNVNNLALFFYKYSLLFYNFSLLL
uniref:Uncharacterized protein n=1 Tax=Myoviridae sp. ct04y17 TaxID=2827652 RepID=A0A8S5SID8_9CAUD|nr:MAG TPA: hypothetical protein [Myoviridae sp. ct04y17]